MSVLRILLILIAQAACGCSSLTKSHSISGESSARNLVERLFVERLDFPKTFQYFHFWGLDSVKSSFDRSLLNEYTTFKEDYYRRVGYLTRRGWTKKFGLGSFPIFARMDPLTMCASKPLRVDVFKISEDETSAIFRVKYIQLGNHARYSSVRTVKLKRTSGKWLLTWVSTTIRDGDSGTTSTFVSQLKYLTEKLYSETAE